MIFDNRLIKTVKRTLLFFICSTLFVLVTNSLSIGSINKSYGIAGHSICVVLILTIMLSYFIKSKLSLVALVFMYILTALPAYYLSSATYYAGRAIKVHNRIIVDGNLSAILISCMLILLTVWSARVKSRVFKAATICLFSLIWIAALIQFILIVYYGVKYGAGPTGPALFSLLQTNLNEAYEYIISQGVLVTVLAASSIILLPIYCYIIIKSYQYFYKAKENNKYIGGVKLHLKALSLMIVICMSLFSLNLTNAYNPYISTAITFLSQKEFKNAIEQRQRILDSLALSNSPTNEGVYIVIIGESLTRDHMSLYGYKRNTTPWQESIAAESGFYKFENPYSCNVVTTMSLVRALTSMSQYDTTSKSLAECPSIVEVARSAGFEVTWLSNHAFYGGLTAQPHSIIASAADNQEWINKYHNDVSFKTEFFDQAYSE